MKQVVYALDKDGNCFNYITKTFLGLDMEKLKAGIFNGPQICILIKDESFTGHMTAVQKAAWCSYVTVIKKFLGNKKAGNPGQLVNDMLKNLQALGARMSIKVHY